MRTDLSLIHQNDSKRIVIDVKFYQNMFHQYFDKQSIHSKHLYQIVTYLMHQPQDEDLRGILIYPHCGYGEVQECYRWNDRITVKIYNINLDQLWNEI
ncbi:hypothetical protein [Halolactibacillus miurensis]|uniref:5-methylcytosine restriction system specificity protein McrC n=1 Tax=Halolactibacillus TaxID=306539 RepID=UPI00078267AB